MSEQTAFEIFRNEQPYRGATDKQEAAFRAGYKSALTEVYDVVLRWPRGKVHMFDVTSEIRKLGEIYERPLDARPISPVDWGKAKRTLTVTPSTDTLAAPLDEVARISDELGLEP